MKKLNEQDTKTLNRLLKTYGIGSILTFIGKKEKESVEVKICNFSKKTLEDAKPSIGKFVGKAESVIENKIVKPLGELKESLRKKDVEPKNQPVAKSKKFTSRK